jgi:putative redox protein
MDLVTVTHRTGSEFSIRVRGHEVVSDMSVKDGGCDAGPSPVELFAGSLGACIAMLIQRYCDSHGYRDGAVGVSLTVQLADNPKRIGTVTVDLEVPKDVPENRKEAIRRLAQHCPIHETLKQPLEIDIEVVIG